MNNKTQDQIDTEATARILGFFKRALKDSNQFEQTLRQVEILVKQADMKEDPKVDPDVAKKVEALLNDLKS